ncbi:MAG: NAD(P)/FAD-dependent oxidoreductase [Candidatus Cohnella colombiensis]|uniref:NAD(P)/FAD-dependent oxidoreductase n=1 Tax=Candidatus Cohnella colombiensis TaxID=3121368 RepID=A0AA95JC10_9BACL|nr:MAG: NAD(P)/FAD-dependent oxidoreductase [Cohnella sp.]
MRNIVILGGGYGGLTVAQEILETIPKDVTIYLVDRMSFQGLKTEYYALAAGTVSDLEIRVAFPIHPQCKLIYGEITDINLEQKLVYISKNDPLPYDSLIIALGCTDNYHGTPGAFENSCGVQSLAAARRTYKLLNNTRPYGQISIVGGGLSGVEIASELRESRPDLNIRIIDRGNSVLSAFPSKLQRFVTSWFNEHHVELRSNVGITSLEQGCIINGNESINTDITVWTAGIQPVEIVQQLNLPKDQQGRLIVNERHELPDAPQVYVIGDCSSQPFSPSAQLAIAQGKQVAEIIKACLNNKEPKLARIQLKGVLGSLGKKSGFGVMGQTPLLGRIPRMLKSGVLWKSKRHFG